MTERSKSSNAPHSLDETQALRPAPRLSEHGNEDAAASGRRLLVGANMRQHRRGQRKGAQGPKSAGVGQNRSPPRVLTLAATRASGWRDNPATGQTVGNDDRLALLDHSKFPPIMVHAQLSGDYTNLGAQALFGECACDLLGVEFVRYQQDVWREIRKL